MQPSAWACRPLHSRARRCSRRRAARRRAWRARRTPRSAAPSSRLHAGGTRARRGAVREKRREPGAARARQRLGRQRRRASGGAPTRALPLLPPLLASSGRAPAASSASHTSRCPSRQAKCRHLQPPSPSASCTLAPSSSSVATRARLPLRDASCSAPMAARCLRGAGAGPRRRARGGTAARAQRDRGTRRLRRGAPQPQLRRARGAPRRRRAALQPGRARREAQARRRRRAWGGCGVRACRRYRCECDGGPCLLARGRGPRPPRQASGAAHQRRWCGGARLHATVPSSGSLVEQR